MSIKQMYPKVNLFTFALAIFQRASAGFCGAKDLLRYKVLMGKWDEQKGFL